MYTHAPCDLQSFKKEGKRKHCAYLLRMWRRSLKVTKPSVALRASFRDWRTHAPDLEPTVERCKAIAQRAARIRPFDSLSMNARRRWNEMACVRKRERPNSGQHRQTPSCTPPDLTHAPLLRRSRVCAP